MLSDVGSMEHLGLLLWPPSLFYVFFILCQIYVRACARGDGLGTSFLISYPTLWTSIEELGAWLVTRRATSAPVQAGGGTWNHVYTARPWRRMRMQTLPGVCISVVWLDGDWLAGWLSTWDNGLLG